MTFVTVNGRTYPDASIVPSSESQPQHGILSFLYEVIQAKEPPESDGSSQLQSSQEPTEQVPAELDGEQLLAQAQAQAWRAGGTSRAIVQAAQRQNVPVHVLDDADYQQRFPNSEGVNANGAVYLPKSSLADGDTSTLLHEYVHALVGEAIDTNRPAAERITATASVFEQMGLNPKDGEYIARATEGWPDSVAASHVATYYLQSEVKREKANDPPLSPLVRAEFIDRIAHREMALALQRDSDNPFGDALLVDAWQAWPQGRKDPPPGETTEEKIGYIMIRIAELSDEENIYRDLTVPGDTSALSP